jgi:hypothetical protein
LPAPSLGSWSQRIQNWWGWTPGHSQNESILQISITELSLKINK